MIAERVRQAQTSENTVFQTSIRLRVSDPREGFGNRFSEVRA